METVTALTWRKSTFSGNDGGNCVEAASAPGRLLVRDTTDRDGAVLSFAPGAWREFAAAITGNGPFLAG
ncbi:MAG TPA: DUF397 domain-containing protein [Trebonia sp.]